jgi:hypothetical protein
MLDCSYTFKPEIVKQVNCICILFLYCFASGELRSCSCPSLTAYKVAAAQDVRHAALRCIASVFAGVPYGMEAVDAAVCVESRRPTFEGRLGLVQDVQELAPNPYHHRSGEAS